MRRDKEKPILVKESKVNVLVSLKLRVAHRSLAPPALWRNPNPCHARDSSLPCSQPPSHLTYQWILVSIDISKTQLKTATSHRHKKLDHFGSSHPKRFLTNSGKQWCAWLWANKLVPLLVFWSQKERWRFRCGPALGLEQLIFNVCLLS